MRHCREKLLNRSGMLNGQLGVLQNGEDNFKMWKERMWSHRNKHPKNAKTSKPSQQRGRPAHNNSAGHNTGRHTYSRGYLQRNNQQQTAALIPACQRRLPHFLSTTGMNPRG